MNKVHVVVDRVWSDPVEATRGPMWGFNPDGSTWYEPGDTYRRFIPGIRHRELVLDNGEVVPWDRPGPSPDYLYWDAALGWIPVWMPRDQPEEGAMNRLKNLLKSLLHITHRRPRRNYRKIT